MTDLEQSCPLLREIRATKCTTLSKDLYREGFSHGEYTDFVLASKSRLACFLGYLFILVKRSLVRRKLQYKWARIIDIPKSWSARRLDAKHCKKTRARRSVILVDLWFGNWPDTQVNYDPERDRRKLFVGHSTVLLIEHAAHYAEYFEPYGSPAWSGVVEPVIKSFIQDVNPRITLETAVTLCPRIGIQALTRDERCHLWTLLYIYLRLECPKLEPQTLQRRLIEKGRVYLKELMQAWLCYLWLRVQDRFEKELSFVKREFANVGEARADAHLDTIEKEIKEAYSRNEIMRSRYQDLEDRVKRLKEEFLLATNIH